MKGQTQQGLQRQSCALGMRVGKTDTVFSGGALTQALASPGLVPDAKFIQNSVKYRFTWFTSNCKPGGDIPRCMNVELLLRALCCDLTHVYFRREKNQPRCYRKMFS